MRGAEEREVDLPFGKWSANRATAWRVSDGKRGKPISLEEAVRIAERVGLPVPGGASA